MVSDAKSLGGQMMLNHLAAGGSRKYGTKIEIQNGCVGYIRTYVIYSMVWGHRNVCMGETPPSNGWWWHCPHTYVTLAPNHTVENIDT